MENNSQEQSYSVNENDSLDRTEQMRNRMEQSMILCPVCRGENYSDSQYCAFCGRRILEATEEIMGGQKQRTNVPTVNMCDQPDESETKICPECGRFIQKNAEQCPYCGALFWDVPIVPDPPLNPNPLPIKDTINMRIVIVSVVAAVAIIVCAMFIFRIPPIGPIGPDSTSNPISKETPTPVPKETPTPIPIVTPISSPTPTPIPSPTPTPIPSPTPTQVQMETEASDTGTQSTIKPVDIVDDSTGQLITVPNDTPSSYGFPESDVQHWTMADVSGMTAGEVRYCINEIVARHGYIFKNSKWTEYFSQKTWYTPSISWESFNYDERLSTIEHDNLKLLNKYYEDMGFPRYD